jgi:hypothetical protein
MMALGLRENPPSLPASVGIFNRPGATRIPGPLNLVPLVFMAPVAVNAAVTKKFKQPAPAKIQSSDNVTVHDYVDWELFPHEPIPQDVSQGALATCPLASILAAMANTPTGPTRLRELVKPFPANVETDVSVAWNQLYAKPASKIMKTSRYFVVNVGNKTTQEVSEILYSDDADKNWSPIYMHSKKSALWPCIIEKGYAVNATSYEKLDEEQRAEFYWERVFGVKPDFLALNDKTKLSEIQSRAKNAKKKAAIAASKEGASALSDGKVEDLHGYAILGIDGANVQLYNPWGHETTVTVSDIRSYFSAILSEP